MSNMQLEDLLTILGRVGTVNLRKGTNDISATPGHEADNIGWTCTVQLAGYNNSGGMRSEIGNTYDSPQRGLSMKDAAAQCLADLEAFLAGPKGAEDRGRYVRNWEIQTSLTGKAGDFGRPTKAPGPLVPEAKIEWGDGA